MTSHTQRVWRGLHGPVTTGRGIFSLPRAELQLRMPEKASTSRGANTVCAWAPDSVGDKAGLSLLVPTLHDRLAASAPKQEHACAASTGKSEV